MTRNILTISATILALSTLNASSQTIINRGSETCDKWAAAHSSSPVSADASAFDNWVLGYLNGKANLIDAEGRTKGLPPMNILRGLDESTIVRLTGEFCRTKPLRTVAEAADQFAAQAIADNSARAVSVGPAQVKITGNRPLAETTGSGDITGSITPHACETVTIKDASNDAIRRFRKCD